MGCCGRLRPYLFSALSLVGTSRCDVPARVQRRNDPARRTSTQPAAFAPDGAGRRSAASLPSPRCLPVGEKKSKTSTMKSAAAPMLAVALTLRWQGLNRRQDHWPSNRQFARPSPRSKTSRWCAPVDAFILARLEREKLTPRPKRTGHTRSPAELRLAGSAALPEEVADFLADHSARPTTSWSNGCSLRPLRRALGTPRLDVAGYADSNGYFDADSDGHWPGSIDYVVRSFNADHPSTSSCANNRGRRTGWLHLRGDLTSEWWTAHSHAFSPQRARWHRRERRQRRECAADRYRARRQCANQRLGFPWLTVPIARCQTTSFEPVPRRKLWAASMA